jgi:hypothetical protein
MVEMRILGFREMPASHSMLRTGRIMLALVQHARPPDARFVRVRFRFRAESLPLHNVPTHWPNGGLKAGKESGFFVAGCNAATKNPLSNDGFSRFPIGEGNLPIL